MSMHSHIPPELFGYKVIDRLGEGAASTVYAVADPKSRQVLALKHVLRNSEKDQRFIDQLEQEHKIGSKLDHPNIRGILRYLTNKKGWIGPVTDAGLVMELIDAATLEGEHRPSGEVIARYFAQAARGLAHMHDRGSVHADMKPSNMMVNDDGTVKIIDLGQACPIGTKKARVQGTPGYIAPEQAFKEAITPATDVYNFGATLHWVLVRTEIPCALPSGETSTERRVPPNQIRAPRPVHEQDPAVPPEFNDLVQGCVRVAQKDRIQSMEGVAERLEAIADLCARTGKGRELEGRVGRGRAPDRRYDSEASRV
jgi:serine/threonine protein kinase